MKEIGKLSEILSGMVRDECFDLLKGADMDGESLSDEMCNFLINGSSGNAKRMMAFYDQRGLHLVSGDAYYEFMTDIKKMEYCKERAQSYEAEKMYQDYIDIEIRNFFKIKNDNRMYIQLEKDDTDDDDDCYDSGITMSMSIEDCLEFGLDPNEIIDQGFCEPNDEYKGTVVHCLEFEVVQEKKEIELVEIEKEKKVIQLNNIYDILKIYFQLYSSSYSPRVDTVNDVILEVQRYFDSKEINCKVIVINLSSNVRIMCEAYIVSFFRSDFLTMKRLGLFPTMTYFLTSSMEKYIRLCDLMSPFGYVVFRQDYMLPEVQGDPLYVALVKAKRMRFFEVNYIVEDTSLMLSKMGYTAGAYIKDMMRMGSDTFSKIFFGSRTLWTSTVICKKKKDYYVSIVGVEGYIGPVSGTKYGFDVLNYIFGTDVSFASLTTREQDKRSAGVLSIIQLRNMLTCNVDSTSPKNGYSVDYEVPNEFYFSYEFYGESDEVKKCFFQLIEPYVRGKVKSEDG